MALKTSQLIINHSSIILRPKHINISYQFRKSQFSIMASQMHQESNCSQSGRRHVCSIIPVTLLQEILNNQQTSTQTRAAVQKTFNHVCKLQQQRVARDHHHAPSHGIRAGIIPPQIFQAVRDSEASSSEQKERAEKDLEHVKKIHALRVADKGTETATSELYRVLYTSAKTDTINKTLLFEEGAEAATVSKDQNASEVYDFFGKTYNFYSEVCHGNRR
jgi:hypothetical protein